MKLPGFKWLPLVLTPVILFGALSVAPVCNSIPERDLHACFWTLKSSSLFSSTVGDSARLGACEPFRRKDLIFQLCGITLNETGKLVRPKLKFKIDPKTKKKKYDEPDPGCTNTEIKKYIETGAY